MIAMIPERIGVKRLIEPIDEVVLVRNRIRLWVARNAYTVLFLAIFGWLSLLTLVVSRG